MSVTILVGDVLDKLASLKDESVHCVVTSPPYWGLRDYGTATWKGGDPKHQHVGQVARTVSGGKGKQYTNKGSNRVYSGDCKCGAKRVDNQLGLEPTVEEYVENMVAVFREVRRVLRKDGTLWLNMGDCYSGGGGYWPNAPSEDHTISGRRGKRQATTAYKGRTPAPGLKPKDLVGQPWRLAFALQADGWWLRSDIIWAKQNPMPESCRDRPTKSHEYIFMLTKAPRYFWDQEAVREGDQVYTRKAGGYKDHHKQGASSFKRKGGFSESDVTTVGRNSRSVWTIPTQPFPDAHFATFPEELPRRCIAAGTSEKGCCPKCGAPWVRVVEKKTRGESWSDHKDEKKRGQRQESNDFKGANYYKNTTPPKTTGWRCSCDCVKQKQPLRVVHDTTDVKSGGSVWTVSDTPAVPCTVLDPFSGAGTTGLVAVKMGRSYIGIELNAEYAKMSEDRILGKLPLLIGED